MGWLTLCCPAGAKLDHERLELVWYDEFEGNGVDRDKWSAGNGDDCGAGPCNRNSGNKQVMIDGLRREHVLIIQ